MSEKAKAIIAYLLGFIGGIIILLTKGTERDTRLHAAQSIVISIGYWIANMAYSFFPIDIPFFSVGLSIIYFACIITGMVKANKGEDPEMPVLGQIAKNIFNKQIEGE